MKSDLTDLGEFGVVDLFREAADPKRAWAEIGIGDDCAVLRIGPDERLLVTTDILLERVHFLLDRITPWQLGYKSMAVNLSDIAAMGGEPAAAFLSIALTADRTERFVREFRDGLLDCAREFGVDLLGGDTSCSDRDLFVCLTVLGRARANEVVLRSGARKGDGIFAGRTLGDSAAGLHLLTNERSALGDEDRKSLLQALLQPRPQVELGRLLATRCLVSAMIDVSDGVLADLGHVCQASAAGAELDADGLPLSDAARRLAALAGLDPRDWALSGGEDYCLLFCVPQEREAEAVEACRDELGAEITRIGRIAAGSGVRVLRDGAWTESSNQGYDHFASPEEGK